ncbi:MAG: KH domain-containing protein [Proteobacteria bacterium]|nr:KH domain-containing protein [Pseudomonadota bacterium]
MSNVQNTELVTQIKELITFILNQIITHPEELSLTEEIGDNSIAITVKANKEDRGQIIGKKGNMIRSIRAIVRSVASKAKVRTIINMID